MLGVRRGSVVRRLKTCGYAICVYLFDDRVVVRIRSTQAEDLRLRDLRVPVRVAVWSMIAVPSASAVRRLKTCGYLLRSPFLNFEF